MKTFSTAKLLLIMILLTTMSAFGQGTLQGVVTDSLTHEKLIGINVQIEGTSLGNATNIEGQYKITGIPARLIDVKISCIGYETKRTKVDLSAGNAAQLNVQLKQTILQGEAVVITAQMRGQVAAINQQISSKTIVNVVSEEKIKEMPDANAAEAIGRLPGVSLIRSGGEATKVVLRGLSSKFSNITVDGTRIPSTDSTSRDVDLSTISQGSLAGIELFKTLTPDQDGDAIAGAVNFVTRKAPSERSIILDVKGAYNHLMASAKQYDVVARYSERLFDDVVGVQLQGNIEQKIRSKEDITYAYQTYRDPQRSTDPTLIDYSMGSFTVDFTDEDRTRNGGQAIFDFNTPDSGNIKLSALFSSTGRNSLLNDRQYVGVTGSGAMWDYVYRYTETQTSTMNTSLLGRNSLAGFDIDWSASYAHSKVDNPFDFALKFTETPGVVGSVPSGRDHPELYIIPYAANDFTAAACSTGVFYSLDNFDKERTAFLNVERKYSISDQLSGALKFGGRYRDRSRWMNKTELDDNTYLHAFSTIGVDTTKMKNSRFADYYLNRRNLKPVLADFIDLPPSSRKLMGKYRLIPLMNIDALKQWYELTRDANVNGEQQYGSSAAATLADYGVNESISAAYLMNTLNIGSDITVIAGVRMETERDDYLAKLTDGALSTIGIRINTPNPLRDSTARHSETIWLPNLQVSVRPTEYLTVRAAAYKALARPDYNLRLPAFYISGNGGQTMNIGNPQLKNTKAWNFELNTQVYDNTIGLISVSGFYKVIDDLYHQMNNVSIDDVDSLFRTMGMTWQETRPYDKIIHDRSLHFLYVPYNSSKTSYAWGLEFEHQMSFGFLPGYLSNIVLSYNVSVTRSQTYIIGSRTDTTRSIVPNPRGGFDTVDIFHHVPEDLKRESEGQPNLYGNAMLGYDIGGFSARLSFFYQDEFVLQYSQDGQTDIYVDSFAKWDLSFKQQITDYLSVILNINNITNRQETTSFKNNKTPWQIPRTAELYGTTADLGFRINL